LPATRLIAAIFQAKLKQLLALLCVFRIASSYSDARRKLERWAAPPLDWDGNQDNESKSRPHQTAFLGLQLIRELKRPIYSRIAAGAFGFLTLIQFFDGPECDWFLV